MTTGKSIAELEARIKELEGDWRQQALAILDIEEPCGTCGGIAGRRIYGSTSTWRGGIGGAAMTEDVCDKCWGTGDLANKGRDLREMCKRARDMGKRSLQARIDAAELWCKENAIQLGSGMYFVKPEDILKILTADEPPSNTSRLTTLQQCQECGLEPQCPPVCPSDEPQAPTARLRKPCDCENDQQIFYTGDEPQGKDTTP